MAILIIGLTPLAPLLLNDITHSYVLEVEASDYVIIRVRMLRDQANLNEKDKVF